MVDEEKLNKLIKLKAARDDAERQINEILGGEQSTPAAAKVKRKCSNCGSTEHRADACTQHQSEPTLRAVEGAKPNGADSQTDREASAAS